MDVDVSFLDAENWNEQAMRERMRWLRQHDPVHWSEKDGVWLVTRYEDVVHVSKHQELFTSARGVRPGTDVKIGLIDEGEPRHGQLRGLINKGFTPRMVKKLEVTFRELTKRAIDAVTNDGQCDFVQSISVPLPLSGTPGAAGAGSATLALPVPASPSLAGAHAYLQAYVFDTAAPGSLSMTPGLGVRFCD